MEKPKISTAIGGISSTPLNPLLDDLNLANEVASSKNKTVPTTAIPAANTTTAKPDVLSDLSLSSILIGGPSQSSATVVDNFPELDLRNTPVRTSSSGDKHGLDHFSANGDMNSQRIRVLHQTYNTVLKLRTSFNPNSSSLNSDNASSESIKPKNKTEARIRALMRTLYRGKPEAQQTTILKTIARAKREGRLEELLATLETNTQTLNNHNDTPTEESAINTNHQPPASAFLTISSIQMQLASLQHWHRAARQQSASKSSKQEAGLLVAQTSKSLISLLETMPLGMLGALTSWEQQVLDNVVDTLQSLKEQVVSELSPDVDAEGDMESDAADGESEVQASAVFQQSNNTDSDRINNNSRLAQQSDSSSVRSSVEVKWEADCKVDDDISEPVIAKCSQVDALLIALGIQRGSLAGTLCAINSLTWNCSKSELTPDVSAFVALPSELGDLLKRFSNVSVNCPLQVTNALQGTARTIQKFHVRMANTSISTRPRKGKYDSKKVQPTMKSSTSSPRELVPGCRANGEPLQVGDKVTLVPGHTSPVLSGNETGEIIHNDGSAMPYKVCGPRGSLEYWFRPSQLMYAGSNVGEEKQSMTDNEGGSNTHSNPIPQTKPSTKFLACESVVLSTDGRFAYILGPSVCGITKVGTGLPCDGPKSTIPGHVYKHRVFSTTPVEHGSSLPMYAKLLAMNERLFVATRLLGDTAIHLTEIHQDTLSDVVAVAPELSAAKSPNYNLASTTQFDYIERDRVVAEQFASVAGADSLLVSPAHADGGVMVTLRQQNVNDDVVANQHAEGTVVWRGSAGGNAPDGGFFLGEGKWMFETTVVQPGAVVLGWVCQTSLATDSSSRVLVGTTAGSWGLNLARGTRCVNGEESALVPPIHKDDVVSCSIEVRTESSSTQCKWLGTIEFSVNGGPLTVLVQDVDLATVNLGENVEVGVRPAVTIYRSSEPIAPPVASIPSVDSPLTTEAIRSEAGSTNPSIENLAQSPSTQRAATPTATSTVTSHSKSTANDAAVVHVNVGVMSDFEYPRSGVDSIERVVKQALQSKNVLMTLNDRIRYSAVLPPITSDDYSIVQVAVADSLLPYSSNSENQNGTGKELVVLTHRVAESENDAKSSEMSFESETLRFTGRQGFPEGFPLVANIANWKLMVKENQLVIICDTPMQGEQVVPEEPVWKHKRLAASLELCNTCDVGEVWSSSLFPKEYRVLRTNESRIQVLQLKEIDYVIACTTIAYCSANNAICSWFAPLNTFEIVSHDGMGIMQGLQLRQTNWHGSNARGSISDDDEDGRVAQPVADTIVRHMKRSLNGVPCFVLRKIELCHLVLNTMARLADPFVAAIVQGQHIETPTSEAMKKLGTVYRHGKLHVHDVFVEPTAATISSLATLVEGLLTVEVVSKNSTLGSSYRETCIALLKVLLVNVFVLSERPPRTLSSSETQGKCMHQGAEMVKSLQRIRTRLFEILTHSTTIRVLDHDISILVELVSHVLVKGSDIFWTTKEQLETVNTEMEFFNKVHASYVQGKATTNASATSQGDMTTSKDSSVPSSISGSILRGGSQLDELHSLNEQSGTCSSNGISRPTTLDLRASYMCGILTKLNARLLAEPCETHFDWLQPLVSSMLEFALAHGKSSILANMENKPCSLQHAFSAAIVRTISATLSGMITAAFVTVVAAVHDGVSNFSPGSAVHQALDNAIRLHFRIVQCSSKLMEFGLQAMGDKPVNSTSDDESALPKMTAETEAHVGDALRGSVVGSTLPHGLCWIEMVLRWRSSTQVRNAQMLRTVAMRTLLQNDPSLSMTTKLVGLIIRVTAKLTENKHARSKPFRCQWAKVEHKEQVFESSHDYENDERKRWSISFPGAQSLQIVFDERTCTEVRRDFLRFLRIREGGSVFQGGYHDTATVDDRFGEERYSGVSGWPGVGTVPPLVIPGSQCVCTFTSDSSDVMWGYKFTVTAQVLHTTTVICHPWHSHLSSVARDLSSALVFATLRTASPVTDCESRLLRWVQNPILSGGLRNYESIQTVSMRRSDSMAIKDSVGLVSSRGRSRTLSMSEEDADAAQVMLVELCNKTPGGLGEKLFTTLRAKRVALDQGYYTHAAVAAMAAALFKVNGLERDALKAVRSGEVTPRLLRVWSAAQHIRRWVDQIVVNGQHKRHLEACGVPSEDIPSEADCESPDDFEEAQYNALCKLLVNRARFLVDSVEPPTLRMVSLRSSRQEVARARWHRLRQHFCPSINQPVQNADRWDVVLRGVRAIRSLRSMINAGRSAALRVAAPISRQLSSRRTSQSRQSVADTYLLRNTISDANHPDDFKIRARAMSHPLPAPVDPPGSHGRENSVDSNFEMYPLLETQPVSGARPVLDSDTAGLPPLPGHRTRPSLNARSVSDSDSYLLGTDGVSPSLSLRSSVFPGSPLLTPTSMGLGSSSRSQHRRRRRERISGGLRRSSVSSANTAGGWEGGNDVDMAYQEQEQSLSESVVSFLQSTSCIANDDLRIALEDRNRRAQVRIAGFDLVNALIALSRGTQKPSHAGKALFDTVVRSTTAALRGQHMPHMIDFGHGDETGQSSLEVENDANQGEYEDGVASCDGMEAHYLTDLAGCNLAFRNSVAARFLTFLKSMSLMTQKGVRKLELNTRETNMFGPARPPRSHSPLTITVPPVPLSANQRLRSARQVQQVLQAVALDYVENDYGILAKSDIIPALLSVLLTCNTTSTASEPMQQLEPELEELGRVSWRLFELLLKRCVCESGQQMNNKNGGRLPGPSGEPVATQRNSPMAMSSGHGLQQSLLDLLVALLQRTLTPTKVIAESSSSTTVKRMENILDKADLFSHLKVAWETPILPVGTIVQYPAPAMVARAVSLKSSHVLHFSLTCDVPGVYQPGRLFSVGNSSASVNPHLDTSRFSPSARSPTSSRWLWMQVSLDSAMRIVVTVADECEREVEVTSRHSLESQSGTVNDVYVAVVDSSTVEVHIVKMIGATAGSNVPRVNSPSINALPSEPVYAVDRFLGVLDGVGVPQSPLADATRAFIGSNFAKQRIEKGDIVTATGGPNAGLRGVVLNRENDESISVLFPNAEQPCSELAECLTVVYFDSTSRNLLKDSVIALREKFGDLGATSTFDSVLKELDSESLTGTTACELMTKIEQVAAQFMATSPRTGANPPMSPDSPRLPPPPTPPNSGQTRSPQFGIDDGNHEPSLIEIQHKYHQEPAHVLNAPVYIGTSNSWGVGGQSLKVASGIGLFAMTVLEDGKLHVPEEFAQAKSRMSSSRCLVDYNVYDANSVASPVRPSLRQKTNKFVAPPTPKPIKHGTGCIENGEPEIHIPRNAFKSDSSVFRILALASAASESVVGKARLAAPYPLGLVFQTAISTSKSLQTRVAAARILRSLLMDVSPRAAASCVAAACPDIEVPSSSAGVAIEDGWSVILIVTSLIGDALFVWNGHLKRSKKSSESGDEVPVQIQQDAEVASTMAYEFIDMLHALCEKPVWANLIGKWVAVAFAQVDEGMLTSVKSISTCDDVVLRRCRDSVVAMAIVGGAYDTVRVGGNSMISSGGNNTSGGNAANSNGHLEPVVVLAREARVVTRKAEAATSDVEATVATPPQAERVISEAEHSPVRPTDDGIAPALGSPRRSRAGSPPRVGYVAGSPSPSSQSPTTAAATVAAASGSVPVESETSTSGARIDITKKMKISVSSDARRNSGSARYMLDVDTNGFWESNGYTPHWVELQCPPGMGFATVSIRTDVNFDSYSPRKVTVKLGSSKQNLREIRSIELEQRTAWVRLVNENDVMASDRVFVLQILRNHSGGCDSRVRGFRVMGRPIADSGTNVVIPTEYFQVAYLEGAASTATTPGSSGMGNASQTPDSSTTFNAYVKATNQDGGSLDDEFGANSIPVVRSALLRPEPIRPPDSLLMVVSGSRHYLAPIIDAFICIIGNESKDSEENRENRIGNLVIKDFRTRCLKALCCLLRSRVFMDRLGPAILPTLLKVSRKGETTHDHPNIAHVAVRWAVNDRIMNDWDLKITTAVESENKKPTKESVSNSKHTTLGLGGESIQSSPTSTPNTSSSVPSNSGGNRMQNSTGTVTITDEDGNTVNDPFASKGILGSTITFLPAGRVHRGVVMATQPILQGKHSWDCKLLEDSNGDETSLFGITSMPQLSKEKWSTSASQNPSLPNFLSPTADHWLLRSFNGNRYHRGVNQLWEGMAKLRIHPGDVVHCELDMDKGVFVMSVNDGTPIQVFRGIKEEAPWGVYPCVASYGNKSYVRVQVTNLKLNFKSDGTFPSPFQQMLVHGESTCVEQRMSRASKLLHESPRLEGVGLPSLVSRWDSSQQSQTGLMKKQPNGSSKVTLQSGDVSSDEDDGWVSDSSDSSVDEPEAGDQAKRLETNGDETSADPAASNESSKRQTLDTKIISKPAALYQVLNSSALAEEGNEIDLGKPINGASSSSTDHSRELADSILLDPRFASDPTWLTEACDSLLTELVSRLSAEALEFLVVDWSVTTPNPMPQLLIQPETLPRTLNLVFNAAMRESSNSVGINAAAGTGLSAGSAVSGTRGFRSLLAIRTICGSSNRLSHRDSLVFFGDSWDPDDGIASSQVEDVETSNPESQNLSPVADGRDRSASSVYRSLVRGGQGTNKTLGNPQIVAEMLDLCVTTFVTVAKALSRVKHKAKAAAAASTAAAAAAAAEAPQQKQGLVRNSGDPHSNLSGSTDSTSMGQRRGQVFHHSLSRTTSSVLRSLEQFEDNGTEALTTARSSSHSTRVTPTSNRSTRVTGSSSPSTTSSRVTPSRESTNRVSPGSRGSRQVYTLGRLVEAKIGSWRRYYPGIVTKINSDATYQIHFDDGEVQDHVSPADIRPVEIATYSSSRRPNRGDAVEARFRGHSRWYPGIIHAVHSDGTSEIHYTDGDVETNVRPELIRPLGAQPGWEAPEAANMSPHSSGAVIESTSNGSGLQGTEFELNQNVEARFQGRSWYPGVIAAIHTDNTYDIHYCDGDREFYVNPSLIRAIPNSNTPTRRTSTLGDETRPASSPGTNSSQHRSWTAAQDEPSGVSAATTTVNVSGSTVLEQGMQYLLSDRFGGELPLEGKPDSAQVSIINHPAVADGVVVSITMRLADTPAGGSDTWDVMVFEMLGEGTCNFLVVQDGSKPARGVIRFDPNSREPQTLQVQGKLRIAQGQYLGVMNRSGRLNVSYTPGKKKPGESWSDKPVEVFYLMPRSVPDPLVGGPHRAKQWHGRAGWYSVVSVEHPAGVDTMLHRKHLVNLALEELTIFPERHPLRAHTALRQACWVLKTLVAERFVFAGEVFAIQDLVHAIRKISKCGLFLVDAASPSDNAELAPNLSRVWLPVINMVTELCQALEMDGIQCAKSMNQQSQESDCNAGTMVISPSELHLPLPPIPTRAVLRLRDLVEHRACEMFVARQQWSEKEALKGGSGAGNLGSKNASTGKEASSGQVGDTTLWFQRLLQCLIALNSLSAPPEDNGTLLQGEGKQDGGGVTKVNGNGIARVHLLSDVQTTDSHAELEVTEVTMILDTQDGTSVLPLIQYRCKTETSQMIKLVVEQTNMHLVAGEPSAVEMLAQIHPGDELTSVNGHKITDLLQDIMSEDENVARVLIQLAMYGPVGVDNQSALAELSKFLNGSDSQPASRLARMVIDQCVNPVELKFTRRHFRHPAAAKLPAEAAELNEGKQEHKLEWLDALVTATDLLKSFAERQQPPTQLLQTQFVKWRQRCGRVEVESKHPFSNDSIVTSPSSTTSRTIHVAGATSLKLHWDPRSCLNLDGHSIVVTSNATGPQGPMKIFGFQGRPPPIAAIPGDSVTISIIQTSNEDRLADEASSGGTDSRVAVRGLVNDKGRVMRMGTVRKQRARFYCGSGKCKADQSDAVQCRSCQAFVPHNKAGFPMTSGDVLIARRAKTSMEVSIDRTISNTDVIDKLYCGTERKCSPHLPDGQCGDCATFQQLMESTGSLSRVSLFKKSDFETEGEYTEYLSGVVCPGMILRCRERFQDVAVGDHGEVLKADRRGLCHLWWKKCRFSRWVPWQCLELVAVDRTIPKNNSASSSNIVKADNSRSSKQRGRVDSEVAKRRARQRPEPIETSDEGTGARFLERKDFETKLLYARYVSSRASVGMHVRCCSSYDGITAGDRGVITKIDETSEDLPCQVAWKGLGSSYWVQWEDLSLNLDDLPSSHPSTDGKNGMSDAIVGGVVEDDLAITFDAATPGPDVQLYNANRSATRTRSIGWGTQVLSVKLDGSHDLLTVNFCIDDNSSNHLFIGVVADPSVRCMIDRGSWGIRRDGSLHSNGVEIRAASPSLRLDTGVTFTMKVNMSDPMNRTVSFWKNEELLGEVSQLPNEVYPAICFGGINQRISIVSGCLSILNLDRAIPGWGYRLMVVPEFSKPSQLSGVGRLSNGLSGLGVVESGDVVRDTPAHDQGLSVGLTTDSSGRVSDIANDAMEYLKNTTGTDPTFETFVALHKSWTRTQDEVLCAFVYQASSSLALSLKDLLALKWEDLCSKRLVVSMNTGTRDEVTTKETLDPFIQELIKLRYPSSLDGLTAKVFSRAIEVVAGTSTMGSPSTGGGQNDTFVERAARILEDLGQRFELIRLLNSSVYQALSLLDLTTWQTPGTPAFHLSECCTVLFDSLKHQLWCDAINISRSQNSSKFELVLDFGRALSRRGQADLRARHTVFAQAFRVLHSMPPQELRVHGKLYKATLRGMGSHDDGGPYRQSFTQYCAELQTVPGVGLFLPCANRTNQIHVNRDRWLPNPAADSLLQQEMFEFVGKLMGIAIRNNEYLDLRLPSLVWKLLVNQVPTVDDLRAVDLLSVTNFEAVGSELPPGGGAVSGESFDGLSFTVITLDGREVELVPGGMQISVSRDNHVEWMELTREYKLHEFDVQVDAIRRGLATIVPQRMLMLFSWEELELMVCGQPQIDLKMLRDMTVYSDCSESDPHIQYLWKVLEDFSDEQRSMYIKFVWGRSRLPVRIEDWEQPHKLAAFHPPKPANGGPPPDIDMCLPFGHTCYFTLDVPRYSSEEIMKKKLLFAIENCPEIDGDQTTTGRRSAAMGFEIYSDDEGDDDSYDLGLDDWGGGGTTQPNSWEGGARQSEVVSGTTAVTAGSDASSSGMMSPPSPGMSVRGITPLGMNGLGTPAISPAAGAASPARRGALTSTMAMAAISAANANRGFDTSAIRSTSFDDASSFTSLSSEDSL